MAPHFLEQQLRARLRRREEHNRLRHLTCSSEHAIDFSSNDYLSLSSNAQIKQSLLRYLEQTRELGSRGSRLLDGDSRLSEDLEHRLARFHGSETALLFNSGFDANVSIFSTLAQPGDAIIYDELVHASVHDGIRATRASRVKSFKHNDLHSLKSVLAETVGHANVFVAVESLYSMDGDFAPLADIVAMVKSQRQVHVVVDEAHTTGLYGSRGRGLLNELALDQDERILIRLHTFGKALGSSGAVVLCSALIKRYLINYARPLIYSTAISPITLLHITSVYDFLETGQTEMMSRHVHQLSRLVRDGLRSRCGVDFAIGSSSSPIIPLITDRPRELSRYLAMSEPSIVARPICFPTVPMGAERVRVCIHAGNTLDQGRHLLERVYQWSLAEQTSSRL